MKKSKYYPSSNRWQKNNTKLINIRCNVFSDKDIIEFLKTKENVGGYIKDFLRAEMKKEGFVCPHPSKQEIANYESYLKDLEEGIQEVGDYEAESRI